MISKVAIWSVKRFRWVLVGVTVRAVSRRAAGRSVDSAAREFESKLPPTLAKALDAAPGDLTRTTGSVIVAQRYVRRAAGLSGRAVGVASSGAKGTVSAVGQVRAAKNRFGDTAARITGRGAGLWADATTDVMSETEQARRELTAQALRNQGETVASDEALLDLRPNRNESLSVEELAESVPDPIPPGRRRFRRAKPEVVDRVRRGYRRPTKPWDEPRYRPR